MDDDEASIGELDEASFSGVGRLFPLPGVTLFPGIVLPLHVYEERYRALVDDALDGDGLVAMAVLKPGWGPDYSGRPPIDEAICLGRILTYNRLSDGRYNLLLAGMRRARILSELEPPQAFRRAELQLTAEDDREAADEHSRELHHRLAEAFRASLPKGEPPQALLKVFEEDSPLGLLTDLAAHVLPIDNKVKREMLAEASAIARAERLIETLEQDDGPMPMDGDFPPPFSDN